MRLRHVLVAAAVVPVAATMTFQGAIASGNGSQWRVVRSPGGPVAALVATSFAAPDDGWAVGSTGQSLVGKGVDTLIEHWDGSRWRVVSSAAVPQSDEALTGVTSTGPDNAWAVGWQDPYGTTRIHAFLMHWDGQSWTVAQGPARAGIVSGIYARTADDVWAVGDGVFEHSDGTTWSVVRPPRSDAQPAAITALSADNAWAVGSKPLPGPGYRHTTPYIAHWNGKSWKSSTIPAVRGEGRLAAVTAVGPDDVWAVGSTGFFPRSPYVLHFDGTSWKQVAAPGAGEGSSLSGIAAISASDVWAVGSLDGRRPDGFAVERAFTQHWDGNTWSIVDSKSDSRHDNFLAAAAFSGGEVWALGGDGGTLVERR